MGCGGATATFSYATWTATFPQLASVSEPQADIYFAMATVVLRNDGTGPVTDPNTQLLLLNLLTAHIATLYTQSLGDPSPGSPKSANSPVGRISNATEGSVSVATDYGTTIGQQQAWLIQTQFGSQYWFLTAQYRTMRYIPGALQPGGSYFGAQAGLTGGFGGFR